MPLYDNLAPDTIFDIFTQSFLVLAEKFNPLDPYTWLSGVAIGEPSPQTLGAVEIPYIVRVNGQIATRTRIVRQESVTRWELPVTLPPANWFSGVLSKYVRNLSTCETNLYLVNVCPTNVCTALYFTFPKALFATIKPTAFTTVEDDAVAVGASSTLYTDEIRLNFYLQEQLLKDDSATTFAVASQVTMAKTNCPTCGDCGCESAAIGGAAGELFVTNDGFSSYTTVVGVPALAVYGRGVSDGSAYILPHIDGISKVSHAGVLINDYVSATAITQIDFSVDGYIAVGENGTILKSTDGISWTAITAPSATADLAAVSSDLAARISYIVGADTGVPVFWSYQTGVVVDLSAAVIAADAAATAYTSVHVADKNMVYVGAGTGELLANPNITGSGDWQSLGDYGTAITGIAGDRARIYITSGGTVFERSPLTNLEVTAMDDPGGYTVTGDYNGVVECKSFTGNAFDGSNYFIAYTDAGEIVRIAQCVLYC